MGVLFYPKSLEPWIHVLSQYYASISSPSVRDGSGEQQLLSPLFGAPVLVKPGIILLTASYTVNMVTTRNAAMAPYLVQDNHVQRIQNAHRRVWIVQVTTVWVRHNTSIEARYLVTSHRNHSGGCSRTVSLDDGLCST